jgi:4a-hydroxytetrahydrobiopterin dehydratase
MTSVCDLTNRHCQPCEGGVAPLGLAEAEILLAETPAWEISAENNSISRQFTFKNFHETMSFINAMAWIANQEDHHPDFSAGYKHCLVSYTTHAIGGLSENDFICAAKIDALLD